MQKDNGKYIWTTKVSNKGQIVLPKEKHARFSTSTKEILSFYLVIKKKESPLQNMKTI